MWFFIKIILKERFNLNTVIFSIDDFYKTLQERKIIEYLEQFANVKDVKVSTKDLRESKNEG